MVHGIRHVHRTSPPDMTELFEMLSTITRRRAGGHGSPFASPKATERWLKGLPVDSDYDAHHMLIEGLERFNAESARISSGRMKALMKLEEAGLPLQYRITEQYVRNQSAFRLARQALWRESWGFWSLMAEAWLAMFKQAYRGPARAELRPYAAEIAARALRYAGLTMRWHFHQARVPPPTCWRCVHKIYRLVERDGLALHPVRLSGGDTHCAREYTLIVLMGLAHPLGYRAQEIESIAQLFEAYPALPVPEKTPRRNPHTHVVDLSLAEGAAVLGTDVADGHRVRYYALHPLTSHLKSLDASMGGNHGLTRQVASLIERGGIRRAGQRTHRFGRVWVAAGMDSILAALDRSTTSGRSALDSWILRDESAEGMGFALTEPAVGLPHGRLVAVSWDPVESVWQLLAIRWNRDEGGQTLLGAQRLSWHPKRVEVYYDTGMPNMAEEKIGAVFVPLSRTDHGLSNLLLPQAHYRADVPLMLRDENALYRLRLGRVLECHEGWLRVDMDVIDRELIAPSPDRETPRQRFG